MIVVIPHDAAQVRYQCLGVQSTSNFVARVVNVEIEYAKYYSRNNLIVLLNTH